MLRRVILILIILGIFVPLTVREQKLPKPIAQFPPTIQKSFHPQLRTFLKMGRQYGYQLDISHLTIKFGDTRSLSDDPKYTTIGYCEILDDGQKIVIDKELWKKASAAYKEQLIAHELTHCLLNRGHRLDLDPFYHLPVSIMFPFILNDKIYLKRKQYYWAEIFAYSNN